MKALSIKVEAKRIPEENLLANEFNLMPVSREVLWKRVGCGDWEMGRSEYGSVVLGDGEDVLKMHIGRISKDKEALEWARQKKRAVEIFSEVSPPTMVIVVDGVDGPRPAVLQEQIHGRPIYKARFKNEILTHGVLEDLATIMRLIRKGFHMGYAPDISGLHIKAKGKYFETFLKTTPLFSDNIMIDNNRAWLVDNVPSYRGSSEKNVRYKLRVGLRSLVLYSWEMLFTGLKFFCKSEDIRRKDVRGRIFFESGKDNKVNI